MWWFAGITLFLIAVFRLAQPYNQAVSLRNQARMSMAGVSAIRMKCAALVPVLRDIAERYEVHESALYKNLVELGSRLEHEVTNDENDAVLLTILQKVLGLWEEYPDLKSTQVQGFAQLSIQTHVEDVSAAMVMANRAVNAYNDSIDTMPFKLVAPILGFTPMNYSTESA